MPELPEVETIVRGLASLIIGKIVVNVQVLLARALQPDAQTLATGVAGRTVVACDRRAKCIVITFDDGQRLVIHLRMTGRLMYQTALAQPQSVPSDDMTVHHGESPAYTVATLHFHDGTRLHFADVRTFGRMRLVLSGDVWDDMLGIEPLSHVFTATVFEEMLGGRRTPLKAFLLDQRFIVGIGNIYACEALWQAGIAPTRAAGSLARNEVIALYAAIRDVLTRAVELRGTTARDYVDVEGLRGGFQNVLAVYGRLGEPCARCSTPIVRTVLAQRGTWSCPTCQPEPKFPRKAFAAPKSRKIS